MSAHSIDHVDLHGGNAVLAPDGGLTLFDWEEATIGMPMFSLGRLLDDARALDAAPGSSRFSATEIAGRDAYLQPLPWGRLRHARARVRTGDVPGADQDHP
jgi:aminoglycoside phosphotransferase (APT) family kinase protein